MRGKRRSTRRAVHLKSEIHMLKETEMVDLAPTVLNLSTITPK